MHLKILLIKLICIHKQLFNTYRSFASDQERDVISRSLQETEDWLYEDGDDETEHAYTSKLEDLKKVFFCFSIFNVSLVILIVSNLLFL
jgi:t-SNARE complex subunit (syntaxin)